MVAVALVAESFSYGTAQSVVQLSKTLEDGYSITVFYGHRQGTETVLKSLSDTIDWQPMPGSGATKHLTNLRFLRSRLSKFDIIHGNSTYGGYYAKILGPRVGAAVLYSPRGYAFLRQDLAKPIRAVIRGIERMTASRCTTVACGPYEAELARGLGGRVTQINNGYEITPPRPVDSLTETVLGVGRICDQKGFDIFLKVAHQVPEAKFTWIGEVQSGDPPSKSSLPENMTVRPFMAHDEALEAIASCRCILLPSRWEGLSRVLIESVCMSKAIVTSRFPANMDCLDGERDQVEFANGYACHNLEQYGSAVRGLATDNELLDRMQNNSFEFAKKEFDLDTIKQQWRQLYQSRTGAA
jgi:glycosyltransferase involved in cell wall biosynthesis